MSSISISILEELFISKKETSLYGRCIRLQDIQPLIEQLDVSFKTQQIGISEENRLIYSIQIGTGKKRILVWSQMHGNESTGTKALFDVLNVLKEFKNELVKTILQECTLLFVPMLNPDGAEVYTRINANNVDLNRDAVERTARESKLLRNVLEEFNPQFCFNLHDQRTIFGVEGSKKPATISFLAPSEEESRAITKGRKETMNVIVAMNKTLQKVIPGAVGLYTDEFYPTATGDNFQKLGYNTILIEAGHYPKDYVREETRKYNFFALLQGIYHIAKTSNFTDFEDYLKIPKNVKNFYDVIHRNASKEDVVYQYEELLVNNKLVFQLKLVSEKITNSHFFHSEIVFED